MTTPTPTPEPARAEPVGGDRDQYGEIKHMRAWPAEPDRVPDATALSRALSMHDAVPDDHRPSDNEPLRNCLPGIWPTVGDLRALLALTPASDAGLLRVWQLIRDHGGALTAAMACGLKDGAVWDHAKPQEDAILSAFAAQTATIAALRTERDRLRANAAGRGEGVEGWQPIATAPYHQEVEVRAGMMRFRAMMMLGASLDADEKPCDQWRATREGEYPPSWSEGACWESNEDLSPSLQPDAWRLVQIAAAPAPATDGTGGRSDGV